MDSGDWRVKREPSDATSWPSPRPRENFRTPLRDQKLRWGAERFQRDSPSALSPFKQEEERDGLRKPINDVKTALSIEEGRRVYVGNLPYEATTKDIESLFKDIAEGVEAINISVDPMTGRNPSYCFVDFISSKLANRVMEEYNSQMFMGRPLKVKPGVKSGTGTGRFDVRPRHIQNRPESNREKNDAFSFDRWRRLEHPEDISKAGQEGRRVYVGGLPRFDSQADANVQLRELFSGFDVQVISKMISAPEKKRYHQGHHNYCFIDLASEDEAQRAITELDGKERWGWNIKVSVSSGTSRKLAERRRLFVSGLPEFPSQEATEESIRELFKGFDVSTVSKLCLPRDLSEGTDGHCFCFVELSNSDEMDRAMAELDWNEIWGGKVRVKPATNSRR
ncbi:related to single-stranded DNA binding protein [Phialocephala subalpina]|uniref:Related to single-stranded DNA binding protein n=1 Tax=Phialocephala subalpina TaxID=576137 RepID=A0A1L7X171_9HELO|nr:related to single-stranded DNA binding protein [Phialocephala subalpina]